MSRQPIAAKVAGGGVGLGQLPSDRLIEPAGPSGDVRQRWIGGFGQSLGPAGHMEPAARRQRTLARPVRTI